MPTVEASGHVTPGDINPGHAAVSSERRRPTLHRVHACRGRSLGWVEPQLVPFGITDRYAIDSFKTELPRVR